ncbi:UdgX family uracil-DNA binding protein [Acuticoccus kandeliae]|uniref:UdgX family uracil-DNA binding protein n=1 Tax=Acuticoccus kandeliae TaxID=2073160 RepID=UPI000D3E4BFD|nr:UdgX family uracil-DNA binding protein [Acuticoccus kandeliae]
MSAVPHKSAETWAVTLDHASDFATWRDAVRQLVAAGVGPEAVSWRWGTSEQALFDAGRPVSELPPITPRTAPRAPRDFIELASHVICHRSMERFALLHRLLARFQHEPNLLRIASDPDVARATRLANNVRRCSHKMKAFVRFRTTVDDDRVEHLVSWFEPEHHTLDITAPFFMRRFPAIRWTILTPERSAHWDSETLAMGPGANRDIAPSGDINEDLWKTYYAAIFNPARLKVKAMTSEMPKRYWKNMPEAEMISPLIRSAGNRTAEMVETPHRAPARSTRAARERAAADADAAETARRIRTLDDLAKAARHCERCTLYREATHVVVGEGPLGAPLMFVGEQPGDQEDLAGRPFVGPAGQLFDRALAEAGIDRAKTFITNAVKHFKFEPRGKRRIHKRPDVGEIEACRFWLDHERTIVRPIVTVALGATAARALSGQAMPITNTRGHPLEWPDGTSGFVTVHPSYLLRLPDRARQEEEYRRFVGDLRAAWRLTQPKLDGHVPV